MQNEVEEYLPSKSRMCIPRIYIARSILHDPSGVRYDFWGLFSERDIVKGEFIGMYNGIWKHKDQSFEFGHRYAIELSYGMMVAPPGQRPDPQLYPIAMANEPCPGSKANATLMSLCLVGGYTEHTAACEGDTLFWGRPRCMPRHCKAQRNTVALRASLHIAPRLYGG